MPTGDLTFGALAVECARALASCGVRHELLTGTEAEARWPINARATEDVLYQPDGGTTLADRAYAALLGSAIEAGATVLDHRPVTSTRADERRAF